MQMIKNEKWWEEKKEERNSYIYQMDFSSANDDGSLSYTQLGIALTSFYF